MRELDFIPDWFRFRNFWPVIFIVLGISIIAKAKRKNEWAEFQNQQQPIKPEPGAETVTDAIVVEENEKPKDDNQTIPNNPQV